MSAEPTIAQLQRLDEQTLLAMLGMITLGGDFSNRDVGGTETDLAGRGKNWLDRNVERFRRLICDNETVIAMRGNYHREVEVIASLIAEYAFDRAGAMIVATYLVKRGLDDLCNG